jgi:hypothetical protein
VSLCIAIGGKVVMLAVSTFTLSWTHSVEKTEWTERWAVTPGGLVVTEARVEGSGAGMEPPDGAVFDGSGWSYRLPPLPQERVILADSGATGPWTLCAGTECRTLGGGHGEPITLSACP